MEIRWSTLGRPTKAGDYSLKSHGVVRVTEGDIADAQNHGDDPFVEIVPTVTFQSGPLRSYIIGHCRAYRTPVARVMRFNDLVDPLDFSLIDDEKNRKN